MNFHSFIRSMVHLVVLPGMWPLELAIYILMYRDYGRDGLRQVWHGRTVPLHVMYQATTFLLAYWLIIVFAGIFFLIVSGVESADPICLLTSCL